MSYSLHFILPYRNFRAPTTTTKIVAARVKATRRLRWVSHWSTMAEYSIALLRTFCHCHTCSQFGSCQVWSLNLLLDPDLWGKTVLFLIVRTPAPFLPCFSIRHFSQCGNIVLCYVRILWNLEYFSPPLTVKTPKRVKLCDPHTTYATASTGAFGAPWGTLLKAITQLSTIQSWCRLLNSFPSTFSLRSF